jgi:hypothetical protein
VLRLSIIAENLPDLKNPKIKPVRHYRTEQTLKEHTEMGEESLVSAKYNGIPAGIVTKYFTPKGGPIQENPAEV